MRTAGDNRHKNPNSTEKYPSQEDSFDFMLLNPKNIPIATKMTDMDIILFWTIFAEVLNVKLGHTKEIIKGNT